MRSIARLFGEIGTLAESILALSAVVDKATGRLRQQLDLDEAPPALPHGEVLDNATESNGSATTKRGKAKPDAA